MYRIGKEEAEEVTKVLASKNMFKINDVNRECERFEEELREKFSVSHSIFVTSGFGALTSALTAIGAGPGDEIIIPAYTYIATAMAVVACGAIPVICDIDETYTIDVKKAEEKITERTKAIIPVHLQGFPCDMDAVLALAAKHNLLVVEDACQADGGSYKGRRLATIGIAGAMSFNHYKIISAGEGGALLTNDDKIFARSLIYQDACAIAFFGNQLDGIDEPQFCGSEFRANEVSAAILRMQLRRLDGILSNLRKNKAKLTAILSKDYKIGKSNDIEGDCGTILPLVFDDEESAREFAAAFENEAFLPIDTGKHIYNNWTAIMEKRGALNPLMDPFKHPKNIDFVPDYKNEVYPVTLSLLAKSVFIPINPDWTDEDIENIVDGFRKRAANK